jgi:hypothetical protein
MNTVNDISEAVVAAVAEEGSQGPTRQVRGRPGWVIGVRGTKVIVTRTENAYMMGLRTQTVGVVSEGAS